MSEPKVVINEFLTFVQNKSDVLDELSILQICASNFTDQEIENGKTELYSHLVDGPRLMRRQGEDKKKKNIKDVIKTLKEAEPDTLPIFVAKDLNRLPPVTFDHVDVTRLLKDLAIMKSEILAIRNDTASKAELSQLQTNLSNELGVLSNTLLSKKQDKSEHPTKSNSTPKNNSKNSQKSLPLVHTPRPPPESPEPVHTPSYRDIVHTSHSQGNTKRGNADSWTHRRTGEDRAAAAKCSGAVDSQAKTSDTDIDGFITVTHKKKNTQKNMRGTRVNSCRILVNEPKIFIYLSRAKKTTTEQDITDYIKEMGETCISVESLQQYREVDFNSFKISISVSQLDTFLNKDFWPNGLVFRRYRERVVRTENKKTL
ncbi:hypothetical protein O0L34_g12782 [Tuta absoluta]|nr:hypothetical protein O0L34_g12782 [Tuta absoluta]